MTNKTYFKLIQSGSFLLLTEHSLLALSRAYLLGGGGGGGEVGKLKKVLRNFCRRKKKPNFMLKSYSVACM